MMFPTQVAQRVIVRGPNGEIEITVLNGNPRIEFRNDPASLNPGAVIGYNLFGNDTLSFETDYMRSEFASASDPQPAWYVRVQGARGIMLDNNTDTLRWTNGSVVGTFPEVWEDVGLTYQNGWTSLPADPVAYYQDPLGFTHLRGRLAPGGVIADGTVVMNIPASTRPARNYFIPVMQDNAPYVRPGIEIGSNGDVRIFNYAAGNIVLDNAEVCTFFT